MRATNHRQTSHATTNAPLHRWVPTSRLKKVLIVLLAAVALAVPVWLASAATTNSAAATKVGPKPPLTAPPVIAHSKTKRNLNSAPVAATIYVNDNFAHPTPGVDPDDAGPATDFGVDSFATIQEGVNAAAPGDTVFVYAGNYTEQVTISKNLTLTGENTATTVLHAPATLDPRVGGSLVLMQVDTSANVDMSGITIAGPHVAGGCGVFPAIFYGVFVAGGANLNLHDAAVTDIRLSPNSLLGCQDGIAIRAGSVALGQIGTVTVNNVAISGYEKSAIIVDNTASSGTITNNTITGLGLENIAANAIQIGRGAGATITGNTITANECTNPSCGPNPLTDAATSTGVLVFSTSAALQINNNTISTNDVGIYNNGDNTTITGNTMVANRYEAIFQDQGSSTITGNTLTGPMNVGVVAASFSVNTGDSTATLTENTITGATTGLQLVDETNADAFVPQVTAHFNRIISTTTAIDNQSNSAPNLENNWWGCNGGPGSSGCGTVTGPGTGFDPWIILGVSASPNSIAPGGTSTVTADMKHDSNGGTPAGVTTLPLPSASFTASNGNMSLASNGFTSGQSQSTFTSGNTSSSSACVMVDSEQPCATITVTPPSFTINDVTHIEGDPPGTTSYVFKVTKSGPTALSSSVNFATQDGSATVADNDYVPQSGTLNFGPTDTTMQVTVQVNHDFKAESDETFTVHLSGEVGATISDADGLGTITNDDTAPSVVYVDDDFTGPIGSDPAGPATAIGYDAFPTIQEGIDAVATGGTVMVAAGNYPQNVLVNKSVTLQGPNSGVDPNTGSRGAEAIVMPAVVETSVQSSTSGSVFRVGTNSVHVDVTINGFTIDGHNPSLTGGRVLNGVEVHTGAGIVNSIGSFDANPNAFDTTMVVQNNIIQNLERYGVLVDNVPARTAAAGNDVSFNKIDNLPSGNTFTGDRGRGIAFEENVYGTASFNVMTRVNVGWQDDNYNLASPGSGTLVDHNQIHTYHRGIFHNLQYQDATAATITNNQITVEATGASSTNFGVELATIQSAVGVTVTNNDSTGNVYGILLWNLPTSANITVSGGTLTNNQYGVFATSNDPQFNAGAASHSIVSGVTITNAAVAGIEVDDSSNIAATALEVNGNTSITSSAVGILVKGANASANVHDNGASIHDLPVGITVDGGSATITANNLYNNVTGLRFLNGGTATAHFNRIISTTTAIDNPGNSTPNLENNWWGCNLGPNHTGCGTVTGTGADFDPWIVLGVSASPNPIAPGGTSTVTADMTHNSGAGTPAGATTLPLPNASFTASNGNLSLASNGFTAGQSQSTFTSGNTSSSSACAMVDSEQQCTTITVTPPSFSIDDVTHLEGNPPGTTSYVFTVTKSGTTAFSSSVNFVTQDGSATVADNDYVSQSGTLNFGPTDTTMQITVPVNHDFKPEGDETFTVHLSGEVGATISDADGLGTITNDDTAPSVVYVDDDFTGPIGSDPAGPATAIGYDAFPTIQEGIDAVASGGTVNVAAGNYPENVTVPKSLSLLGPNASVDPNTGTRVAEAVVRPKITETSLQGGSTSGTIFRLGTGSAHVNVTLKGFTLDGNNPLLTGGRVLNGVEVHTGAGIVNSIGSFDANPNAFDTTMVVQNNIIQNLERYGVLVDNVPARTAAAGNDVSFNKIDNLPSGNTFTGDRGRGIAFEENVYGTASFNVMTRVNVGWQDDNYNLASPGSGTLVDHNQIHTYHRGIFHNLQYQDATAATITNNQITVEATGASSTNFGVELATIQSAVGVTVTNNDSTGNVYGILLWNLPTSANITVSGGTLTNNQYGVFATSNDPQFNAGAASHSIVSGVTITNAAVAGIEVDDSSNIAATALEVNGNTSITSSAVGILVKGANASANVHDNGASIHDLPVGITVDGGSATITANNLYNNVTGLRFLNGGTATAHFNRIISTTTAIDNPGNSTPNLENNWWGCNLGPNHTGCGTVTGTGADFDPWIVLGVSASPNPIAPGGTSTVTADMTHNSGAGTPAGATTLPLPNASFTASNGNLSLASNGFTAGQSQSTFTSGNTSSSSACAMVDSEQQCTTITVTPPSFSIDDVTHLEGNPPGTTSYVFTVTKSGTTAFSSSVNFTTQDGSATVADNDYVSQSGTLNFGPTDTTMQITVPVNHDFKPEGDETFTVHLSGEVGATISDANGLGTITNDDTAPSVVYVDDDFTGPIGSDPAGPATAIGYDAFPTIQGGIDAVATGGTVIVAAGNYKENPNVSKAVTLQGPNVGVAGSAGRGAEANVITNGNKTAVFTITASNITIDGFLIDGDDPLVTGGALKSGDDANVSYGVRPTGAFNHLTVQNNIIKRAAIGFRGDGASQNNLITANWFDSIGNFDFGYCVSLRMEFYAEITNNKMTRAWTGVHINDHHIPGGPANFNISNNEIHSYAGGILYWLNYNAATGASINGNTITAESGAVPNNFGILVVTLQDAVSTTITSNTISGHNYGIGLFNVPTTSNITLGATNSVSNSSLAGIFLTDNLNFNPVGMTDFLAGGKGAASTVNVSGLSISGNSGDGVKVEGTTNAQTLNVSGSTITGTGGTKGVELVSPHSFINLTTSTVTGFATGVALQNSAGATAHFNRIISGTTAIDNPNNQTPNLENNWWGCNLGPNHTGCGTVTGTGADFDPWIVLGVSASPNPIAPGGTSTVTADMTHNSGAGTPAGATTLPLPNASFTASNGNLSLASNGFTAGQSQSTFTSGNTSSSSACAMVDSEQQCTTITVTPPSFSIDDVTHLEGNPPGTTSYVFTVTKSGTTAFSSSVNFTTQDGSATVADNDYVSQSGTLNFGPTDTTMQITVPVNHDFKVEPDETFKVHLANPVDATISHADGLGTITNDDSCAAFSTVYVDDSWAGMAIGDDPDGPGGSATVFGCDSFATIQEGINAVTNPGTVIVAPGTYTENLTLVKSLTIKGAKFGVDARGRVVGAPNPAAESIITSSVANTALLDMNVGAAQSIVDGFVFSGGGGGGTIGAIRTSGSPMDGVQVRNNYITGFKDAALWYNRGGIDMTVSQNVMDGASMVAGAQIIFLNNQAFPGLQILNNSIINGGTRTGLFVDGVRNVNASVNRAPQISGNLFQSNNVGINMGSRSFDAGSITGNTFDANTFDGLQGGPRSTTISGNTFSNNGRSGLALTSFGNTVDPTRGAQNCTIVSNTFTGNGPTSSAEAILFSATQPPGTISTNQVHFNRIVGNFKGATYNGTETIHVENNWWGCNYGPGTGGGGCTGTPNALNGTGSANLVVSPWIVLGASASPASVTPGGNSIVTADMTHNSANGAPSGTDFVPQVAVSFSATNGTIAPPTGTITSGQAQSTFTSTNSSTGQACGMVDGQQSCTPINILLPSFSIDDVTLAEGNSGTTAFTFTITKTGVGAASVDYATADGTATAPSDYTAISPTTLSFASGDASKQVTVQVKGDLVFEAPETFNVHLSNPIDATISDANGLGTINNDDSQPNVVYVDDDFTGPNGSDPDGAGGPAIAIGYDAFKTIQEGVDAVADNGTVNVYAGNYPENVTVPKSLSLLGPNASVDPNTGTRVAEAVVRPKITETSLQGGSTSGTIFRLGTGSAHVNVTLKGFTLDGNNPSLTGGRVLNGVEVHTGAGIVNSIGSFDANPNAFDTTMVVQNNIIQNLERYGVLVDNVPARTAAAGNDVSFNKIDNLPSGNTFTGDRGRGIAFEENVYGTASFNVMTRVNVGWQDDNYNLASPGSGTLVDHNQIHTYHRGIFHNLQYQDATAATITNNQITVEATGASSTNFGVELATIQSAVGVTVTNNSSTGNVYGILIWNVPTTNTITISGGTLTGNQYGVLATSNDPQFGAGAVSQAMVSGVTVSGATVAGVAVQDTAAVTTLAVSNANVSAGTGVGMLADGAGNSMNITGSTITGCAKGVVIRNGSVGNSITGNSIHDNSGLGIDLGDDGVTANDSSDTDSGPNNLQNFPIIGSALAGSPNTISGTLNSAPGQAFTIHLYANPACDPSGNGEGQTLIGSTTANTNGSGDAVWTLNPVSLTAGDFITATATDSTGNTSEFSACFQARAFSAGTITFSPVSNSETNANHDVNLVVSRTGGSDGAVSVQYSVNDGTALVTDNDYSAAAPTGTLTWANGDASDRFITINIKGDTKFEPDETVLLTLSNPTGGVSTGGTNPALTITNDDTAPAFSIDDVTHNEGDSGTTAYIFTITKTGSTALNAGVNFQTADNTATAGSDYQSQTGSLTFLPAETTQTVTVLVNGDTNVEPDETFSLNLSGATNATISDNQGVGTIINDDTGVSVAVSPASVLEDGATNLVYTFTRNGNTTGALSVNFTVGGTATFNSDYTQSGAATFSTTSGTVTFGAGSTTATVTIDPTTDATVEPDEQVILTVTPGTGYNVATPSAATGTITNDDTDVTLSVSPASVTEDGVTNLVYTFTRNGDTTGTLTANFTVGGTATFSSDYTQSGAATFSATNGTVTFAAGNSTATVTIDPTADATVEPDETVILTVTPGTGYNPASPTAATGTITNDDTDVSVAVSPASVLEDGATNLVYTFTRNGNTTGALTANFSVAGTATFGTDYTQSGAAAFNATSGTVTFAAGNSTATVTIDPTADATVEPDETVILTATAGTGYNVAAPSAATGTITNDDTDVSVAVSPASVLEDGATNLVYTFTRNGNTTGALTANFSVAGTATFGTDYTQSGAAAFNATSGTVTFAAGSTTATVTIDPTTDSTVEPDETVILTVTSGTGYGVGTPSAATGTITNDDTDVSVAVSPASVLEDGATNLVYTFTRNGNTTGALTANFTVGGTATFNSDYTQSGAATFTATSGTVTFAAGSTTATVTIDPTTDSTVEPDETVILTVTAGTGYNVATPSAATGTITNDDTGVSVAVSPASVLEDGATNLVYTFTRNGNTTGPLTANFTVGGTATFNSDYTQSGAATFTATNGTVTFAAGSTTAAVTIDPTTDSTVEPDETVILTVTSGTGYNVATPSAATGTITNDDAGVSVAVSPASVPEDGAANLVYTFTRSGANTDPVTVNFTVGGTATFNSDYTQSGAATFSAASGTVAFAAGSSTATVTIDPTADVTVEPDETVILTVTSGTGYGVGTPGAATGTIVNDDGTTGGTLQFSATTYSANESSFLATITVQRLGDTTGAVSVDYATPDDSAATIVVPCDTISGIASPRCDFTTAVGTLQWASGDNAPKSFIVLISEDDYVEGPETLTLTLSNPTGGATLGSPSTAILTIADDPNQPTVNPIDAPTDFVRQHYHDFLNREPDQSGFDFWVGNFPPCNGDPQCIEVKRINVSGAFYLSIEFQGTGFFVERLYKSSYGDATGTSNDGGPHQVAVPIVKFSEFLPDTQEIGRGVVVGADGWEAALEAKKVAFTQQFVQRARFLNAYPLSMTPAQFVDTLNANAGNPLSPAERDQLVSDLTGGAKTRAQVLRAVADDQDLINSEFNRGFVLMQYFGFLRRNPNAAPDSDHSGFDFWLKKLNSFNGNFINAEMVKAFLSSTEYRHRAGGN